MMAQVHPGLKQKVAFSETSEMARHPRKETAAEPGFSPSFTPLPTTRCRGKFFWTLFDQG
jgi:hypothetical protein